MRLRRPHRLSTIQFAEVLLTGLVLFLLVTRYVRDENEVPQVTAEDLTYRLDLNRAEWHELMYLPGIGEVRAREIVRDRRERGPFLAPEDLERVKGIGPATVTKVRDFVKRVGSEDGPADRGEDTRESR